MLERKKIGDEVIKEVAGIIEILEEIISKRTNINELERE